MIDFLIKIWGAPSFIVMVSCLLLFILLLHKSRWKVTFILLMPFIFVILEFFFYEIPHYWSVLSLIGKIFAVYTSYLIPVLISAFFIFTLPESWGTRIISIISFVVGALFLMLTPMTALILVCFIIGDCI